MHHEQLMIVCGVRLKEIMPEYTENMPFDGEYGSWISMYGREFQILITLLKKMCLEIFKRGVSRQDDLILLREEALVEDDK